jgi:hypothetical protein
MRINEILTESQLQQLEEGPIGSALGAVGRGVGKAVGGVAKGVGAVAGGAVGAFNALKKGFQTGKAVVGDDPDPNAGAPGYTAPTEPAARTANTAPAPGAAAPASGPAAGSVAVPGSTPAAPASSTTPPSAAEINAQGPAGTAPAKSQTGAAGQALAKSTAVVDKQQAQSQEKANQTVYAQVKANVDKLDKKGKQRILQLLQKSVAAPAPKAPAAAPGAAPAPAAGAAPAEAPKAGAGAAAMGQMANQLAGQKPNTMANAPVSKTNVAKPGNPNAADPAAPAPAADPAATKAKGGKVAGQVSQTPGAIAKRGKRQAAASAKSAGAGAFNQMANRLPQQNASKDNYGNALSEALAHRVEFHKQKMFETGLSRGSISVFRK